MEAAREVQAKSGRTDLNFTTPEMQQVFSLFCARTTGIHRTYEQLCTRLRTLKKEYNIFRELATKSGWMWDYENHVPVPPTPEILREMCQREGRLKYFDTKKFPWYDLMTRLCGGRMSNGDLRRNSQFTQNSAVGSGTGSSDNPTDEEPRVAETDDTFEQEVPYNVGVEANTSEAGISASRSSGSQKRKERDTSGDMSRGQKIQKRISAKSTGLQQIADTGIKLVEINGQIVEESRRMNNMREDVGVEIDNALHKLTELGLPTYQHSMVMDRMGDRIFRRFFLRASSEQIMDYVGCMFPQHGFHSQQGFNPRSAFNPQQGFNPQPGFNSQPTSSFVSPNFVDSFNLFNVSPRPPN